MTQPTACRRVRGRRPRLLNLFCFSGVALARRVMGVPWMNRDGIRECIPPAYAEHIGRAALAQLTPAQEVAA